MSKSIRIWLLVAAALVLIGCVLLGGAVTMLKGNLEEMSTSKYETNRYEINEGYKNIAIVADTADITFVPGQDLSTAVVCYEQNNATHSVSVKDDTLTIELVDARKWYEHIGIHWKKTKITVYIPQGEYGNLSISANTGDVEIPKDFQFSSIHVSVSTGDVICRASAVGAVTIAASTGDVDVEHITAASLALSVSTGKVTVSDVHSEGDVTIRVSTGKAYLTDVTCKNLVSTGDTGDICLKNLVAAQNLSIKRSTGDVRLEGCDAADIAIQTDTGDVTGTILTDKFFVVSTNTGRKEVPNGTSSGGKCEITTNTGDIRIGIGQN